MADSASPELRAFYREQRAHCPVSYDERAQSYFVYRHQDVKTALSDWQSFSSDFEKHLPSAPFARVTGGTVIGIDPPRHQKLRALIARAFTPRSVEALAPRIDAVVRGLIARFKDRGACELVEEFAGIVPILALADLLGVPAEQHAYFRRVVKAFAAMMEAAMSRQPADPQPQEELERYFTGLLAERRESPRDDLISRLLAAEVDGEHLTQAELVGFCKVLLVAGISTTARLISITLQTLLEHPAELARLRADMSLLPSAIEESMRFRPPVNTWLRVTAKDTEIGGVRIPAGQQVLLAIGSANRDEACFSDPDRFDIARSPNPHVSFGNGVHFCAGAPLARLEAKIALTALLEELTDIEIASDGPLQAMPGIQANGITALPLRFRARRSTAASSAPASRRAPALGTPSGAITGCPFFHGAARTGDLTNERP